MDATSSRGYRLLPGLVNGAAPLNTVLSAALHFSFFENNNDEKRPQYIESKHGSAP